MGFPPYRWGLPAGWSFQLRQSEIVIPAWKVLEHIASSCSCSSPPPPSPRPSSPAAATRTTPQTLASRERSAPAVTGTPFSPVSLPAETKPISPPRTPVRTPASTRRAGSPRPSRRSTSSSGSPAAAATRTPSQTPSARARARLPAKSDRAEERWRELMNATQKLGSLLQSSSSSIVNQVKASCRFRKIVF